MGTAHLRLEVLVSFTMLRSMAYGGIVGAILAIIKILAAGSAGGGMITSVIIDLVPQLVDGMITLWDALKSLSSIISSASPDVLHLAIHMLIYFSLLYLMTREAHERGVAARREGEQA
jgi:hypothetical protein